MGFAHALYFYESKNKELPLHVMKLDLDSGTRQWGHSESEDTIVS